MSNLTVKVNGVQLKGVVGISYIEGLNKLRVVSKLGDYYTSDDYEADSIEVNIVGDRINYETPVTCVYEDSDTEFIGVVGRYSCVLISDDGIVKIVDKDLNWIKLKIDKSDVEKVRNIANRGGGSIYLEVNENGLGRVFDKALE
jgi:hypothetical protein